MKLMLGMSALVAALTVTAPAGAKKCTFKGDKTSRVDGLHVTPKGAKAFYANLSGWPMKAVMTKGDRSVALHVRGPYTFEASVPRDTLPLRHTLKTRTFADGMITLGSSSVLKVAALTDGGKAKMVAQFAFAVRVKGFELPCGQLAVGRHGSWPAPSKPKGKSVETNTPGFALYPKPKGKRGIIVSTADNAVLEMAVLKAKGAWIKVRAAWKDGAKLEGWAKRAELKGPAMFSGHGMGGGCGGGLARDSDLVIRAGAPVFSEEARGEWAKVAKELPAKGFLRANGYWVKAPAGLSANCRRFWIRAADVKVQN